MTNTLQRALILAPVTGLGLFLMRLAPTWALTLFIATIIYHTVVLLSVTKSAGKSYVRVTGVIQTFWLLVGAGGAVFFLESVAVHLVVVFLTTLVLFIHDYHLLHFIHIPAKRGRTLFLKTTIGLQIYTVYLITLSLLGLLTLAQWSITWVLLIMLIVAASLSYSLIRFLDKRKLIQYISPMVVTLVTTQLVWAVFFNPFGYSVSAVFAAIGYGFALYVAVAISEGNKQGLSKRWIYAAIGAAILLLLLARWL